MTIAIPNPSPQMQTVLAYIDGFNTMNIDKIMAQITDDYQWTTLPKGYEPRGSRTKGKDETRESLTAIFRHGLSSFKFEIEDYVEMPGKIALQMKSSGVFTSYTKIYENEYMIFYHLEQPTPDGKPKIRLVKEFVDSLYTTQFFAAE